jgi:hypothetical protein
MRNPKQFEGSTARSNAESVETVNALGCCLNSVLWAYKRGTDGINMLVVAYQPARCQRPWVASQATDGLLKSSEARANTRSSRAFW